MNKNTSRKNGKEEEKSQTYTSVQYCATNIVTYKSVNCSVTYIVHSISIY